MEATKGTTLETKEVKELKVIETAKEVQKSKIIQ